MYNNFFSLIVPLISDSHKGAENQFFKAYSSIFFLIGSLIKFDSNLVTTLADFKANLIKMKKGGVND